MVQHQEQNVSIFKLFSFDKLCMTDGLFILLDTCSTERGVSNTTIHDESPISSVIHQWSSNYMCQLAAEQSWRGECAGLAEVSGDGELERRSYVMIHIRAKASESLAHVVPQINCEKADQVIYNMYVSQQHCLAQVTPGFRFNW